MKNIAVLAIDMKARGLKGYQSNGHAIAKRALQAAYPVLAQLLGVESMAQLARAYWHAQPPVRGDVAQWGAGLADFVACSGQLEDTPYLPDLARLEWVLHRMATLEDATAELSTLALLSTLDPGTLWPRLAPGSATVCSAWPIATLHAAHGENGPRFEEVGRLLQARTAEDAVVWRQGFKPCVRLAMQGEATLIQVLLAGHSLGEALDAAPELDVSQWLPLAVQSGLLLAVHSGA